MLISEIQLLIKQYSSQVILDTSIRIMKTNLLLSLYDAFNLYTPVSVTLTFNAMFCYGRINYVHYHKYVFWISYFLQTTKINSTIFKLKLSVNHYKKVLFCQ